MNIGAHHKLIYNNKNKLASETKQIMICEQFSEFSGKDEAYEKARRVYDYVLYKSTFHLLSYLLTYLLTYDIITRHISTKL